MARNSKDILIAFICFIVSVLFLVIIIPLEVKISGFSSGGTSPKTIPQICCVLIMSMSIIMLVRSYLRDRNSFMTFPRELSEALKKANYKSFIYPVIVFILSIIYYIGFITLGFFITTLIIFPFYARVLGCKKWRISIITDVVLTMVVYYFFAYALKCYLPGWAPF